MRSFWGVIGIFLLAYVMMPTLQAHAQENTMIKLLRGADENPSLVAISGEVIPVVWVAHPDKSDSYFYQRRDSGQYVRSEIIQIASVRGKLLKHIPDVPADRIERVTCASATLETLPDKVKTVKLWAELSNR